MYRASNVILGRSQGQCICRQMEFSAALKVSVYVVKWNSRPFSRPVYRSSNVILCRSQCECIRASNARSSKYVHGETFSCSTQLPNFPCSWEKVIDSTQLKSFVATAAMTGRAELDPPSLRHWMQPLILTATNAAIPCCNKCSRDLLAIIKLISFYFKCRHNCGGSCHNMWEFLIVQLQ